MSQPEIITSDSHVGINHKTGFWAFRILTDEVVGHPFLQNVPDEVVSQVKSETCFIHVTDMKWMHSKSDSTESAGQFSDCEKNLEVASALDNVC